VSQEELDPFDFPAVYMAKFRACSAKIMRSEMIHLHPFSTSRARGPYDILGDSLFATEFHDG
jgi:hypothetical protein